MRSVASIGASLTGMRIAAGGGLRDLDRLAEAAMRDAGRRKRKLVERDAVMRVADADR